MPTLQETNCKNMEIKSSMDNKVSAVNQTVKAIAMARGFLSVKGRDLYCAPGFHTIQINGEDRTAMKFVLKLL